MRMLTLPRRRIIKRRSDFQRVYRSGRSFANRYFVLYVFPSDGVRGRVGFAAGKKLGCAVTRNRVKRLLRESIRPRIPSLKCGYYVFIARNAAATADFHAIDKSVDNLLTRHHLYKTNPALPGKNNG